MSVILRVTGGPSAGLKIVVPRGQVAHVGRTKWADHCIAGDASLAEIHFVVDYASAQCRIRNMSGEVGTMLNSEKLFSDAQIHSGDQIIAGQSTFAVLVQGEPLPAATVEPEAAENEAPDGRKWSADYAAQLDLSAEATAFLQLRQLPEEFLDLLVAKELYSDALRFVAFWLVPQAAVDWGCKSLETVGIDRLNAKEIAAFEAARNWTGDPSEKNRRKAETAAEAAKYEGPGSFLALAAFWSGGSLAPEDLAEVPPAEGLTAQGVTAALLMAACLGGTAEMGSRYRTFLRLGKKLAQDQEHQERSK